MTTTYPSPGIIPAEIAGPEFWRSTIYRASITPVPGDLDELRIICIAELGETYGDKGQPVPMCDEHDAAAELVITQIWPETPVNIGVSGRVPWAEIITQNGGSGGSYSFPAAPSLTGGGGGTIIETPGGVPDVPAPIPLPAAGLLLICAVVALRIVRMKR